MTKIEKLILYPDTRRKFFRRLSGAKCVLELGCGDGKNFLELRENFSHLEFYGVDILDRSAVPDFIGYHQLDLDTSTLPYPNDFFDVILFLHVIEHLKSPLRLGGEINRVLKKQGKIYIETPNWTTMFAPSLGFDRERNYPFNFFDDRTHVKPWSKQGLFQFLYQDCQLRVEKVGTRRNWLKFPLDPLIMGYGLMKRDRRYIVSSFWNLYGWCIFGIGSKE